MRIADFVGLQHSYHANKCRRRHGAWPWTQRKRYAWGQTDGGRIGLGMSKLQAILTSSRVIRDEPEGAPVKCVDVECGYVHSVIVGLDGTLSHVR
jgi:hypothetical protein